jgi:hypothetical protein
MAMATRDTDEQELRNQRTGDDSPPLMSMVPEPPPSHWGKLTGQSRTLSPQYVAFLNRGKEAKNDRSV